MKTKLALLAAGFALAAAGCSTIANGNNQGVNFSTVDTSGTAIDGAQCLITGGRDGAVNVSFTTPAEDVQVRRAKADIDVYCKKDGYQTASQSFDSKMEGTTAGNALAGGFVGLGVDAMTGAMFKYPENIILTMRRVGEAAAEAVDSMSGTTSSAEPMMK